MTKLNAIEKYTSEQKKAYIERVSKMYLEKSDLKKINNDKKFIEVLKRETINALNDAYAEKYIHLDIALKMLERA